MGSTPRGPPNRKKPTSFGIGFFGGVPSSINLQVDIREGYAGSNEERYLTLRRTEWAIELSFLLPSQ